MKGKGRKFVTKRRGRKVGQAVLDVLGSLSVENLRHVLEVGGYIERASQYKSQFCPTALYLNDKLLENCGPGFVAIVTYSHIDIFKGRSPWNSKPYYSFKTPDSVREFEMMFDGPWRDLP